MATLWTALTTFRESLSRLFGAVKVDMDREEARREALTDDEYIEEAGNRSW